MNAMQLVLNEVLIPPHSGRENSARNAETVGQLYGLEQA